MAPIDDQYLDNRLHTETDGNGHTTTYTYDGDDRPTKVAYDDGSYVQYTYDSDGNLTARRNRNASTDSFGYDLMNRPEAETVNGESESFCYDGDNLLTSLTDGGGKVSYNYSNGYLTQIQEPGGSCGTDNTTTVLPPANSRCIAVAMDGDNRPKTVAFPGGVVRSTNYYQSGRVQQVKVVNGSTTLQDFRCSYIDPGNSDETPEVYVFNDWYDSTHYSGSTYSYDGLNRLTNASAVLTSVGTGAPTTQAQSWSYDGQGNVTEFDAGSASYFSAYNSADELCATSAVSAPSCSSGTTYTDDAAGNLTAVSTGFGASYDAAGVTGGFTGAYDSGGTVSTSASYADVGQSQRVGLGAVAFTNSVVGLSAVDDGTTRTEFTRFPSGQLVSMRSGADAGYAAGSTTNSYYSVLDRQGSVTGMTDASGSLNARYTYNPYGNLQASSGSNAAGNANRWLGAAYYDSPTHLYHLGARYYSPGPSGQRFTQTDPKTHPLDLAQQDSYTYAGDNPLTNTDLSGTGFLDDVGDEIGSLASGIYQGVTTGATAGASFGALAGCIAGAVASGPGGCLAGGAAGGAAGGTLGAVGGAVVGALFLDQQPAS